MMTENQDTAKTKYKNLAAKVTADRGNVQAARIMEQARTCLDDLNYSVRGLEHFYWQEHNKLAQVTFNNQEDSIDAAAKLGELAQALQALKHAQTLMTRVTCFTGPRD